MLTDCTMEDNDLKSILGFQLQSIVKIILEIKSKKR